MPECLNALNVQTVKENQNRFLQAQLSGPDVAGVHVPLLLPCSPLHIHVCTFFCEYAVYEELITQQGDDTCIGSGIQGVQAGSIA
jgi:hypothetical protein